MTLSHEDFERLLKMAQTETTLPSAAFVHGNTTSNDPPSSTSWFINLGASDHMIGNPRVVFVNLRKLFWPTVTTHLPWVKEE